MEGAPDWATQNCMCQKRTRCLLLCMGEHCFLYERAKYARSRPYASGMLPSTHYSRHALLHTLHPVRSACVESHCSCRTIWFVAGTSHHQRQHVCVHAVAYIPPARGPSTGFRVRNNTLTLSACLWCQRLSAVGTHGTLHTLHPRHAYCRCRTPHVQGFVVGTTRRFLSQTKTTQARPRH